MTGCSLTNVEESGGFTSRTKGCMHALKRKHELNSKDLNEFEWIDHWFDELT